jgi:hypothetical protein
LDAVAFAGGFAMAWYAGWNTTDLVWSLWLSSLVVGYALIVWNLSATLREFGGNVIRERPPGPEWMFGGVVMGAVFLFSLGFFTVHFGGFHYVHSAFLSMFFPVLSDPAQAKNFPGWTLYAEVLRRYWIFLPIAFMAERTAFVASRQDGTDTAVTPEAISRRKRAFANSGMMAPYRNVIRMHLLIFFFAAAHFAKLENFAVYAVVYAVYFFPWRIFGRRVADEGAVQN